MSNSIYFYANDKSLDRLFSASTPFIFPNFQREYTWGEIEIKELMEDITTDFIEFCRTSSSNLITFIGNLITININNTQPQIYEAFVPSSGPMMIPSLFMVIDGQQRITTFSMIAMSLYEKFTNLLESLKRNCSNMNLPSIQKLTGVINQTKDDLKNFFSVKTPHYKPTFSPLCLRQGVDRYVYDATIDASNYKSPICNIQANLIFKIENTTPGQFTPLKDFTPFKIIDKLLDDIASKGVKLSGSSFANYSNVFSEAISDCNNHAQEIDKLKNLYLWSFYFRNKCYVVHIEALNLDLAFDMFQSLNSTGSPLTSLEVFKPHVLSKDCMPSNFNASFDTFFNFVGDEKRENTLKRTNDIAITTALVYDGTKLSRKFKEQVKYFKNIYDQEYKGQTSSSFQSSVLDTIDKVTDFYSNFWTEKNSSNILKNLSNDEEAATSLLFLRDSNHDISTSVLILFYKNNQAQDFINAIKATTAFYVLWRGAWGTSGLPDVYRKFCKNYNIVSKNILTIANLKDHFKYELRQKGLNVNTNNTNWITLSNKLNYEENKILCKFCLFLYFDNQIEETTKKGQTTGFMTKAAPTVNLYLKTQIWDSKDLKELEHVAPQKQPAVISGGTSWDPSIYQNNMQHDIGNLLLLPKEINISISNKAFDDKNFYYKIIANKAMSNRKALITSGNATNITGKTADLLLSATYISGLEPFKNLPSNFKWDLNFIKKRGEQIRDVVFKRLWDWLK